MPKKRYRNTGESVVAGHPPGAEFEHEYQAHEEEALIAGGAIQVVAEKKTPKKEET